MKGKIQLCREKIVANGKTHEGPATSLPAALLTLIHFDEKITLMGLQLAYSISSSRQQAHKRLFVGKYSCCITSLFYIFFFLLYVPTTDTYGTRSQCYGLRTLEKNKIISFFCMSTIFVVIAERTHHSQDDCSCVSNKEPQLQHTRNDTASGNQG